MITLTNRVPTVFASLAIVATILLSANSASAYDVVNVKNAGGISGRVVFNGDPPKQDHVLISKDNHICGDGHTVMNPVVVGNENGLASAVVRITDITSGKAWSGSDHTPEIVQEDCKFWPYVQVVPKLTNLTIKNKDPLLHNIHAYEIIGRARRTLFNIAQPDAGQIDTRDIKLRRGDIVQVKCDAHNWMEAWVYTSENPYVSVTASDGAFVIEDIPAGTYQLQVWHPTLGESSQEITVKADATTRLDVEMTASNV